jgi:hypothetical protein
MENFEGEVHQKIDPRDKAYRESLASSAKHTIANKENVFGGLIVQDVRQGDIGEEKLHADIGDARKFLQNLWVSLRPESASGEKEESETASCFRPILDLLEEGKSANPGDELLFEEAKKRVLNIYDYSQELNNVPDFISASLIPDAVFIKMLDKHQESFEKRSQEIVSRFPGLKQSFATYFKEFVVQEGINISQDLIDERTGETQIMVIDRLLSAAQDYAGKHEGGVISISSAISDEALAKVFAHEMMHVLGGRLVLRESGQEVYKELREGLRFNKRRFYWLNEAITETLADKIRPGEHSTYEAERRIFEILRISGKEEIPENLFYNAFFENYDPNVPEGERIPGWKKLWVATNEAHGQGFLIKVDEAVLNFGANITEKYLRCKLKREQWLDSKYTKYQLDKIFGTEPEGLNDLDKALFDELMLAK